MKRIKEHLACKSGDHLYLHKDFHGALCYAIKYLDATYGYETTHAYLRQVGETIYKPLIGEIKRCGLTALRNICDEFLPWKEDNLNCIGKRIFYSSR